MYTLRYITCVLGLAAAGCSGRNGLPDLRESYSHHDMKPFGSYAAKHIIETALQQEAKVVDDPFTRTYAMSSDTDAVYFSISRNLYLDEEEAQSMLDYVYMGNTLFISAANIDPVLLEKLHCEVKKADLPDQIRVPYGSSEVSITPDAAPSNNGFSYYYKPFGNHFASVKAEYSRVVGFNQKKKPNAFIVFWGNGRFILHCDPRAFSNYFLLKHNNYEYLRNLLQLVRSSPGSIYWDDHYRKQGNVRGQAPENFSTFSELMKHPSLAAAFWIFVFLLLVFLLFKSKRKQRIIPIIKPNLNSSVAFTETIARLYLQHHDNRNIAGKMITYFHEFIHKTYFLNSNATSADLISALSRKSGVSFDKTSELFETIDMVNNSGDVSDQLLMELNNKLQQFYKN